MALKLVVGVHLCDKSDFYLAKEPKNSRDGVIDVRYDAIKVIDLDDFNVYDMSLEECHKLGYKLLSFSYLDGIALGDNCIIGGQSLVLRDNVIGFAKLGDLYSCDVPLYYKGELIRNNKNRVYGLSLTCCNELRPYIKFIVNFYIDLIDYTVQCCVCGRPVYGELDLKSEYLCHSYYNYWGGYTIPNNILFSDLSETVSDGICTFGNKLSVISLMKEGNYIVPNSVEFVSIQGSGKSNIVIPPSVKRVYVGGDAKCSNINFSLSSNVSNMFLMELYTQFLKQSTSNSLFGRKEILEAFSRLEGINIEFY